MYQRSPSGASGVANSSMRPNNSGRGDSAERRDPASQRDLVVEVLEPARRHDPVEGLPGTFAHRRQRRVRVVEHACSLGQLVGHIASVGHRMLHRACCPDDRRRGAHVDGGARAPRRRVEQHRRHAGPLLGRGRAHRARHVHQRRVRRRARSRQAGRAGARPRRRGDAPARRARRSPPTRSASRTWRRSGTATPACRDGRRTSIPTRSTRQPDDVVVARLVELFEQYRPQVVVTYFDNSGYNHPDHLKAHDVTRQAVEASRHPEKLYLIARTAFVPAAHARDRRAVRRRDAAAARTAASRPDAARPAAAAVRRRRRRSSPRASTAPPTRRRSGPRSARTPSQLEGSFFLRFPDEAFAAAFGTETFIRDFDTTGAPLPEDDLFAGLR